MGVEKNKVSVSTVVVFLKEMMGAIIGAAIMAAIFYSDTNVAKANINAIEQRVSRISTHNTDVNNDQEKRIQVLEKVVTRTEAMVEFLYIKQGGTKR